MAFSLLDPQNLNYHFSNALFQSWNEKMSSRPLSINVVKKVSLPHFLCQTITQWSFFLRCGTIFFTCMLSLWGRHFFYRHCSFFCSHFFFEAQEKTTLCKETCSVPGPRRPGGQLARRLRKVYCWFGIFRICGVSLPSCLSFAFFWKRLHCTLLRLPSFFHRLNAICWAVQLPTSSVQLLQFRNHGDYSKPNNLHQQPQWESQERR